MTKQTITPNQVITITIENTGNIKIESKNFEHQAAESTPQEENAPLTSNGNAAPKKRAKESYPLDQNHAQHNLLPTSLPQGAASKIAEEPQYLQVTNEQHDQKSASLTVQGCQQNIQTSLQTPHVPSASQSLGISVSVDGRAAKTREISRLISSTENTPNSKLGERSLTLLGLMWCIFHPIY